MNNFDNQFVSALLGQQPLKQFAIRNSQFAITFCNGDLTPTQNLLPIEAGDLNPQSSLKQAMLKAENEANQQIKAMD